MKKYSDQELMKFVCRVDSFEKLNIAIAYINKLDYISNETYDDLMMALSFISRELYKLKED